jgi:biopolymer transport protein ExbB
MEWLKAAIDYGIIGFLVLMSIVAVTIAIEKHLFYRRISLDHYTDRRILEIDLIKKINIIATIGSNAPYIGLLGTVLGIMLTFYTMGNLGAMDPAKMMVGLALALKATAVGLLVAIPAVVFNNFLLGKARLLMIEWEMKNEKQ